MKPNIAIIGAGASGLMAANLLAVKSIPSTLFESHGLPGGCASWFRRQTSVGSCIFDVGATVVPSFTPDAWWFRKLQVWGLNEDLGYKPASKVSYKIDDHGFDVRTGAEDFFADLSKAFPQDAIWIHEVLRPARDQVLSLKQFVEALPQWPIESPRQVFLNIKKLGHLTYKWSELKLLLQPFDSWLGQNKISSELRTWFEMNALISIQCPLSEAYAMYALFSILFHSTGSGTFSGGMKRYFEVLLKHYRKQPEAKYLPNTRVAKVSSETENHLITDQNGNTHGPFSHVLFSSPRQLSYSLIDQASAASTSPSQDMWSAMVLYLVVADSEQWPSYAFNWHIKDSALGEEIFASFSPRNDTSRAPAGFRCLNVSHHEHLDNTWFESSDEEYKKRKTEKTDLMLQALRRATGPLEIKHQESSTPRTWKHYTQRPLGTVGGLPLSKAWTLFNTPGRKLGSASLIQIGDTSFPGQSLYSCALSAGIAVESLGI